MRDATPAARGRALLLLMLPLLAACSTTLLNQRIERRGGGWTIALLKLTDGPNDYGWGGMMRYVPADDERFLWARIELRNDSSAPQKFNYDRCDLDLGDSRVLPGVIDHDYFIHGPAPDVEEFKPGETVTRMLIFSYPEDQFPTRFSCGDVTMPLPRF
ncbi:hypothetical protein [Sorangium sp. So ce1153]|uniref:hypothetical protein n=1 Tax=Sorangium sp. So ce1153 TaxID=3133333 RepID=UPI003F5DE0EC